MALPQLPPLKNKKLVFIAGGALLLIVAFVLINSEMQRQKDEAMLKAKDAFKKMQADQTAVIVAKKNIPKGTLLEASMLDTKIFPNKYVQPQAVTAADRVSGMVAMMDIPADDQITLAKVSSTRASAGAGLASVTPMGKRAITIAVDNIASLAGMIKAGNYVDVIAMLQIPVQTPDGKTQSQVAVIPLFQNVLILAVGQDTGGMVVESTSRYAKSAEKDSSSAPLITLALTPQEASLIAFVQEQGKIRLTMRSPADANVEQIPPASWETLFRYIMPQQQKPSEEGSEIPVVVEQPPTVEIYRGLNKETVPLSK
jgi:pilus assembly protein CpaB